MRADTFKRPHKYRAQPVEVDGIKFPSTGEAKRWSTLRLLEKAGTLFHLQRQVSFLLVIDSKPILIRSAGYPNGRAVKYTADFTYTDETGFVVEEYKGFDTMESRLRRAVFEAIYGIQVRVTR